MHHERQECGTILMSVYCPYWMINKTGLELNYKVHLWIQFMLEKPCWLGISFYLIRILIGNVVGYSSYCCYVNNGGTLHISEYWQGILWCVGCSCTVCWLLFYFVVSIACALTQCDVLRPLALKSIFLDMWPAKIRRPINPHIKFHYVRE